MPLEGPWRHELHFSPCGVDTGGVYTLDRWRSSLLLASNELSSSHQAIRCLVDFVLIAPSRLRELDEKLTKNTFVSDDATNKFRGGTGPTGCIDSSVIDSSLKSFAPSITAFSSNPVGLLPISPVAMKSYLAEKTAIVLRKREASQTFAELCSRLALLTLRCLNFLACAGWTDSPVCLVASESPSVAQLQVLDRCYSASWHFLDISSKFETTRYLRTHLQTLKIGYSGEVISVRRQLVCSQVTPAWPKPGSACLFPIIDFVHQELRDDLENPERCLLPRSQWPQKTPRSKVYATDSEWYAIVKSGYELGLFRMVAEENIFRNERGDLILNGAMGVDKIKVVDGVEVHLLRFISNLIPINHYLRKLRGDSQLLPSVTQLSLVLLEDGEVLSLESEDMESCFNLFYVPDAWAGYFAYEKRVPASAFGGDPSSWVYVSIRAVPMGCTFAVDLMQSMARRYVFGLCDVPEETELRRDRAIPSGDISVVCMDGFDFLRRLKLDEILGSPPWEESIEHRAFVSRCKALGLPLNAGKSLVRSLHGAILGGEIDGLRGTLQHARVKGHKFMLSTLALLTLKAPSQPALQHWAGVACFAAGFRRPSFSALEEIFSFISSPGWLSSTQRRLPLEVFDEVLVFAGLLPLCFTNLRAPIRPVISITDASEDGGGSAEATTFLSTMSKGRASSAEDWLAGINEELSTLGTQEKLVCSSCGSHRPDWNSWCKCPMGCDYAFCGVTCLLKHRSSCQAPELSLPRFCEGFCGPRAPLTWAIACCGIPVEKPFDKAFDSSEDFFAEHNNLERFDHELVAVEHWGPDCKLMSRARGKPIQLPSGKWIDGPQAVRSEEYPMGFPNLRGRILHRVRQSNSMFMHALRRLEWRVKNWGFAVLEHPVNSLGFYFPLAVKLLLTKGVFFTIVWNCCHGGRRRKGSGLLHNIPQLHAALHSEECAGHEDGELLPYEVNVNEDGTLLFDTESEAEYPFGLCQAYAQAVKSAVKEWSLQSIPVTLSLRSEWLENTLLHHATKLLAKQSITSEVMPSLVSLLESMVPGKELSHLHTLLKLGDFRGTDVCLSHQTLLDPSRQVVPYPAFAWKWKTSQSYSWRQSQHINALEFTALLNYIRDIVSRPEVHSSRLFHVLDSRVSSCIVAKGRSSSRLLNRLCRRLAAFSLAADLYIMPLWTISKWNFSDAASRQVVPEVCKP